MPVILRPLKDEFDIKAPETQERIAQGARTLFEVTILPNLALTLAHMSTAECICLLCRRGPEQSL
jgi:hypothetical protein